MARMSGSTAVAANSSSANVLSGQLHEIVTRAPSSVRFAAAATATGIVATASIGGEIVAQEALVSQANRFPVLPDDIVAEYGAYPSDRIFLTFRNTTAGSITVYWVVDVEPLA